MIDGRLQDARMAHGATADRSRLGEMIRSAGLESPDVLDSQMPKWTWHHLVHLNSMGIITIDSQPGEDDTKRAYVDGFMQEPHALRSAYVEAMNCSSSMVAVLVRPVASC